MKLFHLTPIANKASIQAEGIRGSEQGKIFVFTDMIVANTIARDQVFTPQFSVFRINPKGVRGKIIPDRVAEIAARWHRVIRQAKILPHYLTLVSDFVTQRGPTEWDYAKHKSLGLPDNLIKAMFDGTLVAKFDELIRLNCRIEDGHIVQDESDIMKTANRADAAKKGDMPHVLESRGRHDIRMARIGMTH